MKKIVIISLVLILAAVLGTAALSGDDDTSSLSYTLNSDGNTYSLTGTGDFTGSVLTIPSSYSGKPVTSISTRAFENNKLITEVSVPETVKDIGKFAFSGCENLKKVILANGVKNLGLGAFYNCKKLESISLPSSVTSIGNWAFFNCAKLSSVSYSGTALTLGVGAFSSCSSLSEVNISSGVSLFSQYCFADCVSLKKITVPRSVKTIGEFAFADCYNLKEIVLLSNNLGIDAQAFYGVTASVRYPCTDETWDSFKKDNYGGSLSWHRHLNMTHVARVEPTLTSAGNIEYWICSDCGTYYSDAEGNNALTSIGYILPALSYIRGDVDANKVINEDDAILSLYHLFFGDQYPVNQDLDFNGDGKQNEDDVIHLLYYIFFGDEYPLCGT